MDHEKRFHRYVRRVLIELRLPKENKDGIAQEVMERLQMKYFETGVEDPYQLLGRPRVVAKEYQTSFSQGKKSSESEYISSMTLFGIPLIHINRNPNGVAKGVVAIGTYALGFFSFGAVSVGVIAIGSVNLGVLFGFGGLSLSLLLSVGGIAISLIGAFGGVAVAYVASFGGVAIAKEMAIGGLAYADVAFGDRAHGVIAIFQTWGEGKTLIPMNRPFVEIQRAIEVQKGDWIPYLTQILEFVYRFRW